MKIYTEEIQYLLSHKARPATIFLFLYIASLNGTLTKEKFKELWQEKKVKYKRRALYYALTELQNLGLLEEENNAYYLKRLATKGHYIELSYQEFLEIFTKIKLSRVDFKILFHILTQTKKSIKKNITQLAKQLNISIAATSIQLKKLAKNNIINI